MTVYASSIELWRAAFMLVGAPRPTSTTGTDPLSVAGQSIYDGLVRYALTKHAWTFAERDATLNYEGESGRLPQYRYALPSDILLPRRLTLSDAPFRDYKLQGQKLFCNVNTTDQLRLFYTWPAPEAMWPADFSDAVMHIFAGRLAKGPLEQGDRGATYEAEGKRQLMSARARDRSMAGRIPRDVDAPLVKAWRGRFPPSFSRSPGLATTDTISSFRGNTGS